MELLEGVRKLESLKSSIEKFKVEQSGAELKNLVEEIIYTLRSIKIDEEYEQGLEDGAISFEEFLEEDIKYFSNSPRGYGKQMRLNKTQSLILYDLRNIIFSLQLKLAEG
jgi:hypothetical protein